MNRREFLKKAGVGSAAAAGLPALETMLATPALAVDPGGTGFYFVVISHSTTTSDLLAISGCGRLGGGRIEGGGSFAHFVPDEAPPFPIVASGHWRARQLVSFDPLGDPYGTLVAGIANLKAVVRVTTPFRAEVPATMEVVCNLGPANLFTGGDEGVVVSVPSAEQTFVPNVPPTGLTVFTTGFFGG